MTLMVAELYDALREAHISDDKARKAAEAVAGYENRFATLDNRMIALQDRMAVMDSKVSRLNSKGTWIASTLITLMVLTLVSVLAVLYRLATP